ncbi:hypothetical protein [Nisaea sp.]|uniref:hypothetical protein n=1 Tax=Nisaea sp. TaxID=2024842 RepID=UPI0032EEA364
MKQRYRIGTVAAGSLLSVVLLTGCVTSMHGYSGVDNEGKREFLTYAAAETPVCLTVSGTPFAGDEATMATAAAKYASGAVFGSSATFTADCGSTAHPDYRIVIHANRALVGSPDQLCELAPMPKAEETGKLRLDAAFCSKNEPLSTAWSEAPMPSGIDDPAFRQMIRTTVNELFPRERDRDRNREVLRVSTLPVPQVWN